MYMKRAYKSQVYIMHKANSIYNQSIGIVIKSYIFTTSIFTNLIAYDGRVVYGFKKNANLYANQFQNIMLNFNFSP